MRVPIQLKNDRSLIAAYSLAANPAAPWIVYLPESGAHFQAGSRLELNHLIGRRLGAQFHFLAINKPGISPRKLDAEAFERSFRRRTRVADALLTMQQIIPLNAKIYLIGYSEGAYLAPEIAELDRRVVALALIGGGTRGWLNEELGRPVIARERVAIRRAIAKIYADPRSTEKWQGFSYATWHSFREDRTLAALKRLRLPTLAILGARDHVIDLPTTLRDLRQIALDRPLQIEMLNACGHSFAGHWDDVGFYLSEFLAPGSYNPDLTFP